MHRLLRFDVILRASISCSGMLTCLLAWFVPNSVTHQLIESGNGYAFNTLVILTGVVVLSMLDLLINDVFPEQYSLKYLRCKRHTLYHMYAGIYFIHAFNAVGTSIGPEDIVSFSYLVSGGVSAWYSWAISIRGTHV